MLYREIIAV